MDSSISRAWTPHAISLSDRDDPLWECWYNLSNLTNQRVYQELVYRNGSFKEMITGSAAPSLPSFLPFYFRLRAFSIQRPNYLGAWNRLATLRRCIASFVFNTLISYLATLLILRRSFQPSWRIFATWSQWEVEKPCKGLLFYTAKFGYLKILISYIVNDNNSPTAQQL